MIYNEHDSNGICLRCGKEILFPKGEIVQAIRISQLVTIDSYGLSSSYEGPMFLCFQCSEKVHRHMERAAKQMPPGE
jgi:DNA-directed RNA polymerase subunit RPC12/RpoP